jgi:hypothetical protein
VLLLKYKTVIINIQSNRLPFNKVEAYEEDDTLLPGSYRGRVKIGGVYSLISYTTVLYLQSPSFSITGEGTIWYMGCDSTEHRGQRIEQWPRLASCHAYKYRKMIKSKFS